MSSAAPIRAPAPLHRRDAVRAVGGGDRAGADPHGQSCSRRPGRCCCPSPGGRCSVRDAGSRCSSRRRCCCRRCRSRSAIPGRTSACCSRRSGLFAGAALGRRVATSRVSAPPWSRCSACCWRAWRRRRCTRAPARRRAAWRASALFGISVYLYLFAAGRSEPGTPGAARRSTGSAVGVGAVRVRRFLLSVPGAGRIRAAIRLAGFGRLPARAGLLLRGQHARQLLRVLSGHDRGGVFAAARANRRSRARRWRRAARSSSPRWCSRIRARR